MKNTIITLSSFLVLTMASATHAADKAAGKAKAETVCAACHGAKGISAVDTFPNLAGQKEGYLVSQLKAFRSGDRKNPIMSGQAAGLSDDDIANLAAHFASLQR